MSITSRRVTRMVTAILLATGYLLLLVPTSSLLAAQKSNEFPKVLEAEQGFLIRHSHDWIQVPVYRDAHTLKRMPLEALGTQKAHEAPQIMITTEVRKDHADALMRLKEIDASEDSPATFLEIGGWPALEREYLAPMDRIGPDRRQQETAPLSRRFTIAVAVGNLLVQLQGHLMPETDPAIVEEMRGMGQTFVFDQLADPLRTESEIRSLQETPRLMQPPPGGAPVDIVEDGSFEAGSPNPFWLEESTGFGTPLCTVAQCGTDGGTGPFSGTWWAWFGGIDEFEEGAVGQTIQGDPGDRCTLSFYLEIPISSGNSTDFLKVSIDGAQLFVVFENSPGYSTYTRVDIDVSDYIDGQINTLRFDSTISGTPDETDFFVDDVAITCKPFVDDFESGNSCNWTSSVPGIGCPPAGWTCDPESYGFDDGCDCGCGVFDPDCLSQSATSCDFCNEIGSCDTTGLGCPGIIDPLDNAICSSVP